MRDLFEDSEQQLQVGVERKTAGHLAGAVTQSGVRLRIAKSVETIASARPWNCRRTAGRHDSVDPGFQPLRHPTNIEGHRR